MRVDQIINNFVVKPKRLFLVDGIEALISAFFLGVLLIKLNHLIGLPENILLVLSAIACILALCSFSCFQFIKKKFNLFIKVIASANIIYSIISISILCFYWDELLPLRYAYFIIEKLIVIGLVYIEIKTASKLKKSNK